MAGKCAVVRAIHLLVAYKKQEGLFQNYHFHQLL